MGRLERRQAGAVSGAVFGLFLLLLAVVMTLTEHDGAASLVMGALGGLVLLLCGIANARVSGKMIHEGRH